MKKNILIVLIATVTLFACKSKKDVTTTSASSATTATGSGSTEEALTASTAGNTTGKVSHKYRSGGCSTVIIVNQDGTELTLIPKDKLSADFDVDGLDVRFNYRTLRMPQPEGCTVGQPAEITDLSKK